MQYYCNTRRFSLTDMTGPAKLCLVRTLEPVLSRPLQLNAWSFVAHGYDRSRKITTLKSPRSRKSRGLFC